jgi:glycosyltransferase involved in cell wall biosynthesis
MKALFVGRKFGGVAGGVERSVVTLLNTLQERGHTPSLLTWDAADAVTHYDLHSGVAWKKLDAGNPKQRATWRVRWQRQVRIRQAVRELDPDVIIGFQHGAFLATRIATLGMGIPVVAAERNAPQRFDFLRRGRYRHLTFLSFLLAKRITIQFEEYRRGYPSYLRSRLVHIPNPVSKAQTLADPNGQAGKPKILLFVGHLSYQKNPIVLLDAFSRLSQDFPDWTLDMVGDGEYRAEVENKITEYGLTDRVTLRGVLKGISAAYQAAQVFCLPSLWEGFPNALAEALAHGLPAVGFAQCAGVNHLIRHGKNGLLAAGNANPDTLAVALGQLMGDAQQRASMGARAVDSVSQYTPEAVFDAWEQLLIKLARK